MKPHQKHVFDDPCFNPDEVPEKMFISRGRFKKYGYITSLTFNVGLE